MGIKSKMVDGNFLAPDGSIPEGQDIVKDLLERCLRWADIVLERLEIIPDASVPFCSTD